MCRRSSILIKSFFPKSKARLGWKNKGFLTIFFILKYKPIRWQKKREDRESVDKSYTYFRGIYYYSFFTVIPCFDCIALCIIWEPNKSIIVSPSSNQILNGGISRIFRTWEISATWLPIPTYLSGVYLRIFSWSFFKWIHFVGKFWLWQKIQFTNGKTFNYSNVSPESFFFH